MSKYNVNINSKNNIMSWSDLENDCNQDFALNIIDDQDKYDNWAIGNYTFDKQ